MDGRSGYFDESGIIRDILQNHLIQLLALICANTEIDNRNDDMNDNQSMTESRNKNKNEITNENISDSYDKNKYLKNYQNEIAVTDSTNKLDFTEDNESIEKLNRTIFNAFKMNINEMDDENRSNYISLLRTNLLNSVSPVRTSDIVVGQYDSYLSENGVKNYSKTETFASCLLQVFFGRNFIEKL